MIARNLQFLSIVFALLLLLLFMEICNAKKSRAFVKKRKVNSNISAMFRMAPHKTTYRDNSAPTQEHSSSLHHLYPAVTLPSSFIYLPSMTAPPRWLEPTLAKFNLQTPLMPPSNILRHRSDNFDIIPNVLSPFMNIHSLGGGTFGISDDILTSRDSLHHSDFNFLNERNLFNQHFNELYPTFLSA